MEALPPDTLSVTGVHEQVQAALRDRLGGDIWIVGEVQSKRQSANGHVYLDLVERRSPNTPPVASLKVCALSRELGQIRMMLKRASGVTISDGVEVRIRGRLTTYAPQGALQLQMNGIDPEYTLGRLAADRDELLKRLAAEGVLAENAKRPLTRLPLKIALVTSYDTAAYHDFTKELDLSGHAFQVLIQDTRVQGEAAPDLVAAALRALTRRAGTSWEPDVVALVRGGGSRTDLAAFDAEVVARSIAATPWPVLTGIGHEIDRSVADEAAHTSFKTPTAVAQALVTRVRETQTRVETTHQRNAALAARAVERRAETLEHAARAVGRVATSRLERAGDRLDAGVQRVGRSALLSLERAARRTEDAASRLTTNAPRLLERESERLEVAAQLVAASDPERLLRRGYSVTRDEAGKVVRDAAEAPEGTLLVTELATGSLRSVVTGAGKEGAGEPEDGSTPAKSAGVRTSKKKAPTTEKEK